MLVSSMLEKKRFLTQSIHQTRQHSHHGLLRKLSRAEVARSRFDLGSERRIETVSRSDMFFDTPSQRLLDQFAPVNDAGPMESPNLVI
jgi:hypothetical protein